MLPPLVFEFPTTRCDGAAAAGHSSAKAPLNLPV